ncbi:MAG: hypothetical protein ACXVGI_01355 [Mycobacteriaceae bacterium]
MPTRTARTAWNGTLQDGSGVAEAAHLPSGDARRSRVRHGSPHLADRVGAFPA